MEFDSEEEREMFGKGGDEDEEDIESEYSSTEEDVRFLKTTPSTEPAGKRPLVSDGTESDTDERVEPEEEEEETEARLERHVSRPRLFSSSTHSTTPTNNEDGEGFFSEDTNTFSAEMVDHASNFISAVQPVSSPTDAMPELIPAADDIGLPEGLFNNPLSPDATPPKSPPPAHETTPNNHTPPISPSIGRETTPPSILSQEDAEEVLVKPSEAPPRNRKFPKSKRRCEECENCLNITDCKVCRYCRDMKKYGGLGRLRQKCIQRQCLRLSRVTGGGVLEWEESETGGPSQRKFDSRGLGHDEEMTSLDIISESFKLGVAAKPANTPTLQTSSQPFYATGSLAPPGSSVATPPPVQKTPPPKPIKKPLAKKPANKKPQSRNKKLTKRSRQQETKSSSESEPEVISYRSTRRRPLSDLYDSWLPRGGAEPEKTQCLGPQCVYAARRNSKYCSEECGIELAMKRIKTYLPQCKRLWSDSEESQASKLNKEKLASLEMEQAKMKERLEELDRQTELIDEHVSKMKETKANKYEEESGEGDSEDLMVYCATCSQPTGLRKALAHMERCFTRMEGQVSFGSIVKNEGINIFCDKYDRSQKTYCKRLKVLCPEHTKEPKVGPNEVCGCPLQSDFPSKRRHCTQYCRNLKTNCTGHYCWEKLRRAEIDQEKLNLYLKLEELSEQMRLLQWQLNYRSSLLSILLHHTINHSKRDDKSHDIDSSITMTHHDSEQTAT